MLNSITVESLKRKREGQDTIDDATYEVIRKTKKLKADFYSAKSCATSHLSLTTEVSHASSSSASTTSSTSTPEETFRFLLIEGMPSPDMIQNTYARKWI